MKKCSFSATREQIIAEAISPVATELRLIDAADLVTEMTLVKHHFAAGVKAQEGVEF